MKYPLLDDKNKLEEKYVYQNMSIKEIADEIGCFPASVRQALKKHNIKIRNDRFKYPKLNDKKWLQIQYPMKKVLQQMIEICILNK